MLARMQMNTNDLNHSPLILCMACLPEPDRQDVDKPNYLYAHDLCYDLSLEYNQITKDCVIHWLDQH